MLKYFLVLFCVSIQFVQSGTLRDSVVNQLSVRYDGEEILVIDTDAGADDAMAISLVLNGTKESKVLIAGITCARGNTGVYNVTRNVLKTLKVNHRLEIPVMAGSDFGLISTSAPDDYFGEDGFGDFDFPTPDVPVSQEHPAVFLSNIVRQNPGKVTVIALAPLTNLAIAGLLYPGFYRDVRQIIFLGGSTSGHGGMDGGVEFNIWGDVAAAKAVFSRSPLDNPITVVPTETLHNLYFSWNWRVQTLGTKGTKVIAFLNQAERKAQRSPRGWKPGDPIAAAVFLHPETVLESFLGLSKLTPNGTMTVDKIDETQNTQRDSSEYGYIKVVGSINKTKLKQIFYELL